MAAVAIDLLQSSLLIVLPFGQKILTPQTKVPGLPRLCLLEIDSPIDDMSPFRVDKMMPSNYAKNTGKTPFSSTLITCITHETYGFTFHPNDE